MTRTRPEYSTRKRKLIDSISIWFTASMLGIGLLMICGLILLILVQGLGALWPKPLCEITLKDGRKYLGIEYRSEYYKDKSSGKPVARSLWRVGNRDLYGNDYVWVKENEVVSRQYPKDVVYIERLEWGPFYGKVTGVVTPSQQTQYPDDVMAALAKELPMARQRFKHIHSLERGEIANVGIYLERNNLALHKMEMKGILDTVEGKQETQRIKANTVELQERYQMLSKDLEKKRKEDRLYRIFLSSDDGKTKDLPLSSVVRIHQPNNISVFGKLWVYAGRLREFFFDLPREANSEGGVAPAIFGTVLMTVLMSLFATPLGVITALYIHEYAKPGVLLSIVRISVNNLAGVPSIVFGVFGLGFFCYLVGGTIDSLFFSDKLPNPTFGGGGILWAALTLALLTIPVVIVASEEAFASVPNGLRAASLALGATRFQTILRVVLPSALPGILTGLILAIARGAGEVAPLMITGVVKLAPDMPLDGWFPFLHLDRRFMHLGFHIYDAGFQSPNIESSKPMVYMTTLLLIAIVVCLNMAAMRLRGSLRNRLQRGGV